MKNKINVLASDADLAAGPLIKCYEQIEKKMPKERCDDIILNLHVADLVRRHGSKKVREKIKYVMNSLTWLEKKLKKDIKSRKTS